MSTNDFRYLKFGTKDGTVGYGCFSITYEKQDGVLKYAVSPAFCAPTDQFRKAVAREIATGRAKKGVRFVGEIPAITSGKFMNFDEFAFVVDDIMREEKTHNLRVPNWAKTAWEYGIWDTLRPQRQSTPAVTADTVSDEESPCAGGCCGGCK